VTTRSSQDALAVRFHRERSVENGSLMNADYTGRYVTTAEAAACLRYRSASAIRNLIAAGRLVPTSRRGCTYLFRKSDLDATHALHLERP
jgi:hypothetical protein